MPGQMPLEEGAFVSIMEERNMKNRLLFNRLGLMLDCSNNAVMKLDQVKNVINILEKLNYNYLMIYTEDTYEIDNHEYFGHLRGRYTKAELKELDDYAFEHGIELMPCIQTLAHLSRLMRWPEFIAECDCNDILCAGEESVYALIDDMFSTLEKCFRSRTVNVGMDEADFIGLGNYLKKHGYKNRIDILLDHLNRVSSIAQKHGFSLLMWGDMFFKLVANFEKEDTEKNPIGTEKTDSVVGFYNNSIDDNVREKIPENTTLIYWDYYSTDKEHYDKCIKAHQNLSSNIWFAGGIWTWTGFVPHNSYSIKAAQAAIKSCLENNVQNVLITLWGDDGAECSPFSILPALFSISEFAVGNNDIDDIKAKFKNCFGISFDDFNLIELPQTPNTSGKLVNADKYMLYNDCFNGVFDCCVTEGVGNQYKMCAERIDAVKDKGQYSYIFDTAKNLCEVLSIKYEIGVRTRKLYLEKDYNSMKELLLDYDKLIDNLNSFYFAFEHQWMLENKPQGFDIQDIRIGGLILRIKHCKKRLEQFLNGDICKIEELEEPVLDISGDGMNITGKPIEYNRYNNWAFSSTVNVISPFV